jgi:parallel beta-helix repeat protein
MIIPVSLGYNVRNTIEQLSTDFGNSNTLYVGGLGPGNYTTIQSAIDDAVSGDTVYVFDDSSPYYESLLIDKSINLIGKDRNTTIIDFEYKDDTIDIKSHYVSISDFCIINGGDDYHAAINVEKFYNYTKISNNNIFYNQRGIELHEYSSYNYIFNNNISYNNGSGIVIDMSCRDNIIQGNIISYNLGTGISDSGFSGDSILFNKVFKNRGTGIFSDGRDCNICYNEVFLNDRVGIYLSGGDVYNVIVSWNYIYGNGFYGISATGYFWGLVNNVEISNNHIEKNKPAGIELIHATFCKIRNNNIFNQFINVQFINSLSCFWDGNYWGSSNKIIKLIFGSFRPFCFLPVLEAQLVIIPVINIDFNPASEPYDIGGLV